MAGHLTTSRSGNRAASPTPDQVREARERAGLSTAQAASIVYSTPRYWQMCESGDRRLHPGLWELFQIKTSEAAKPTKLRKQRRETGSVTDLRAVAVGCRVKEG